MSKILVTGCMGTLGRPLVAYLKRQGHEVWGADLQHQAEENYFRANVSSYRQLERVFEQDYDFVYHMFHTRLDWQPEISISEREHKASCWATPQDSLSMDLVLDEDACIKLFYGI